MNIRSYYVTFLAGGEWHRMDSLDFIGAFNCYRLSRRASIFAVNQDDMSILLGERG